MSSSVGSDASAAQETSALEGMVWQELWRRKVLILLVALAGAVAATVASFAIEPVYRVQTVLIQSEALADASSLRGLGSLGGLASLAGIANVGGGDQAIESIALLRSRKLVMDFIKERKLLPVLFAKKWDASKQAWKVPPDEVPTENDAFKHFDKNVRQVSQDKKTGLVTLTIEWTDREAAADWSLDLVRRLNEMMRVRTIAESDASIVRLTAQLNATDVVPLQMALASLIEAQIKKRTIAAVQPDFALRILDPPTLPDDDDHSYPKKPLFFVFGLAAGLMLGVAVAYFAAIRTVGRQASRTFKPAD